MRVAAAERVARRRRDVPGRGRRSRRCGSASRSSGGSGSRGAASGYERRRRRSWPAGRRRAGRIRQRRRLRRAARPPTGQADAPRCRAGLRPNGSRGAHRRRRARDHERLPLRRRAGGPVRPPSGPEVGRAARRVAAPQRAPSSTSARGPPTAGSPRTRARFHFVQRYAWEPWHYGYLLNPRSSPRDGSDGASGGARGSLPGFVPARFAPALNSAAQRWSVSATLLAAQLFAESGFNPFAVSPAGAQGIAQFMPATARGIGLRDPFDPHAAIDAQARLMRDLLRRFGAVPLALAAYNAGSAPVAACGCVPADPGDARLRGPDPRADVRRRRDRRRRGRRPDRPADPLTGHPDARPTCAARAGGRRARAGRRCSVPHRGAAGGRHTLAESGQTMAGARLGERDSRAPRGPTLRFDLQQPVVRGEPHRDGPTKPDRHAGRGSSPAVTEASARAAGTDASSALCRRVDLRINPAACRRRLTAGSAIRVGTAAARAAEPPAA